MNRWWWLNGTKLQYEHDSGMVLVTSWLRTSIGNGWPREMIVDWHWIKPNEWMVSRRYNWWLLYKHTHWLTGLSFIHSKVFRQISVSCCRCTCQVDFECRPQWTGNGWPTCLVAATWTMIFACTWLLFVCWTSWSRGYILDLDCLFA